MSLGLACGLTALSAGCGSSIPIAAVHPGYDTPIIPTRPLLTGMFFVSHSIESYASVLSSIAPRGPSTERGGRCITKVPSLSYFPRMSCIAKM